MNRLQGKVAPIFGAGPNMGGTVAHFFAREGARLAISDINADAADETAQFLRERGYEVEALTGSATAEPEVTDMLAKTVERYGRLDCIMNTAGKVHWSSVLDMRLDDWNEAVLSFPTAGL